MTTGTRAEIWNRVFVKVQCDTNVTAQPTKLPLLRFETSDARFTTQHLRTCCSAQRASFYSTLLQRPAQAQRLGIQICEFFSDNGNKQKSRKCDVTVWHQLLAVVFNCTTQTIFSTSRTDGTTCKMRTYQNQLRCSKCSTVAFLSIIEVHNTCNKS
jgi:hypothetical protein